MQVSKYFNARVQGTCIFTCDKTACFIALNRTLAKAYFWKTWLQIFQKQLYWIFKPHHIFPLVAVYIWDKLYKVAVHLLMDIKYSVTVRHAHIRYVRYFWKCTSYFVRILIRILIVWCQFFPEFLYCFFIQFEVRRAINGTVSILVCCHIVKQCLCSYFNAWQDCYMCFTKITLYCVSGFSCKYCIFRKHIDFFYAVINIFN